MLGMPTYFLNLDLQDSTETQLSMGEQETDLHKRTNENYNYFNGIATLFVETLVRTQFHSLSRDHHSPQYPFYDVSTWVIRLAQEN